jgi:hypothetical protein
MLKISFIFKFNPFIIESSPYFKALTSLILVNINPLKGIIAAPLAINNRFILVFKGSFIGFINSLILLKSFIDFKGQFVEIITSRAREKYPHFAYLLVIFEGVKA